MSSFIFPKIKISGVSDAADKAKFVKRMEKAGFTSNDLEDLKMSSKSTLGWVLDVNETKRTAFKNSGKASVFDTIKGKPSKKALLRELKEMSSKDD